MPFASDKAYDIAHYIGLYAIDTGFEIGINEIPNLTRKLSWDGETTCTERIASIATQFDNAEISYSFETKGLLITHKYINIFKKRGKDTADSDGDVCDVRSARSQSLSLHLRLNSA